MRFLLLSSLRTIPSALWLFATGCWFVAALFFLVSAVSAHGDSLWANPNSDQRGMYADRKASRVGDILTVVVSESTAQSSTQSKKTNSGSSVDSAVDQFLFPSSLTHKGSLPAIKFSGSNDFSGGGEVNNSQNISGRAAVLVTEVLPNGNLVIEGVRRLTFSGETQHVVLHGMVRPDDISSSNTVVSSSVANARLEFITEGELTVASKKGWLTKLYETLRPF